eukprot:247647_1
MSSKKFVKSASYESIEDNDEETALTAAEHVNDKAANLIAAKYGSSNGQSTNNEKQTELAKVPLDIGNDEIKQLDTFAELNAGTSDKSIHNPIEPTIETFELPRDVLVAYFLIRLENDGKDSLWGQYSACGKLGIIFAVLTPILIQYFVACTLIAGLDIWNAIEQMTDTAVIEVWYNTITLAILFIYMFRDVHGYTANVWKFIGRVEEEQKVEYNPLHRSRLKNIGTILKRWDYHELDPRQINVEKQKRRAMFIEFRLLILAVLVLYGILTFYSLVQIAYTDELADKLEVSLSIFFLLELDDWSYDLFISQNGILEDNQFDVEFPLVIKKNKNKFEKKRIRSVIFCEDIPQLIIQSVYLSKIQSVTIITSFSIIFSVISIVIGMLSVISVGYNIENQHHIKFGLDIIGKGESLGIKKKRIYNISKIKKEIASPLAVDPKSIEIFPPKVVKNGYEYEVHINISNTHNEQELIRDIKGLKRSSNLPKTIKKQWKCKLPKIDIHYPLKNSSEFSNGLFNDPRDDRLTLTNNNIQLTQYIDETY